MRRERERLMGCDIHITVESRARGATGGWEAGGWEAVAVPKRMMREYELACMRDRPGFRADWLHRNYMLFSMLAGVRNDFGVKPIAQPRGWPDDATEEAEFNRKDYGVDGHSHSWLSLGEIMAYEPSDEVRDRCGRWFHEVLPELFRISKDGTEVRIVFFFDC